MRCLYFSDTCTLADPFIEVSLEFVEERIQHAKQYQKSTMILQLIKSLYAHDVIDDLPLSVFGGCNWVPKARYGTLWSLLTYGYHKLQLVKNWKQTDCDTILRNMKSHIESMYCIETGRRSKMKTRNSINSDEHCLMSSRNFWKWKFPNFQIYGFYDFFSSKAWNLQPPPLKIIFFVFYDTSYIQNTGNGNNYLNLPIN